MADERQQRVHARLPIEIKVEYRRLNAFVADFSRDLSGGGLFVRTGHPLPVGTECLFTLELPNLPEPLSLRGIVRRVVENVAEGSEEAPGMGVELLFDDDAERRALRTVVDDLMVAHLGEALYRRLVAARQ
jgi:type IV pilus assembly protein PilZ